MTGGGMFFAALMLLAVGYPVAFTFGSVSIFFGVIAAVVELQSDATVLLVAEEFFQMFSMMPFRIYSIMKNTILMAVPLFIFMGIVLQRSDLAERLLEAMGTMFGRIRGGVAVSTVLVGALLAASTGVVGASVVAMGVISLPVMDGGIQAHVVAIDGVAAVGLLKEVVGIAGAVVRLIHGVVGDRRLPLTPGFGPGQRVAVLSVVHDALLHAGLSCHHGLWRGRRARDTGVVGGLHTHTGHGLLGRSTVLTNGFQHVGRDDAVDRAPGWIRRGRPDHHPDSRHTPARPGRGNSE